MMLTSIDEQEHSEKIERLKVALSTLTDLQKETVYKKFYLKMTNVDIAAEEGVSETAIRNRLKKIYANLSKKNLKAGGSIPPIFLHMDRGMTEKALRKEL
ncbi:hypothetical protein NHG34_01570 [Aerococcaceae bacterium NML190938]|nr:hypothetical protein [Aerococcaceae bacterium NML190938]